MATKNGLLCEDGGTGSLLLSKTIVSDLASHPTETTTTACDLSTAERHVLHRLAEAMGFSHESFIPGNEAEPGGHVAVRCLPVNLAGTLTFVSRRPRTEEEETEEDDGQHNKEHDD